MYRRKRHRRTYRKNTRRTLRKTNTLLREILLFLQSLLRQPFVKTVLLIFVILTILLVPVPWLITKITPSADPGHFGKSSQTAPFALAEIPKKVTVWRTASHKTETVDFEDYVKGVVSSEMPSSPGSAQSSVSGRQDLFPGKNPEIRNRRQSQITPQGSCLRLHPLPGLPESF